MSSVVTGEIVAKLDDTLTPWSIYIAEFNGTVPDLDDYDSIEFHAWSDAACPATDLVAWTSSNVTTQPTKAFTSDTTAGIKSLYCVNHGLRSGMQVKLTTSGTLPTELATETRYYVVRVNGHNVWLCKQRTGSPIEIVDSGSGTHSFEILGHIQYQPQAADVDTAGVFRCEIRIVDTAVNETFPGTAEGIPLTVVNDACD